MSWMIDTSFAGANACSPSCDAAGGAPVASIAADARGGPEALWFRLRLRRLAHDAPAPLFELRDPGLLLGAGDGTALRPALRVDGGGWTRLGAPQAVERGDGRRAVRWALPAAAAAIELALCRPYGQDDLDRLLGDCAGALRLDAIGTSAGGRPLPRVLNRAGDPGRPGFYLIAGQHAGEMPGMWLLDGLLRRVAALGAAAPLVWAAPIADPDGVAAGAYGKDQYPVDLNRAWWTQARRLECAALMADLARWRARCAPALCLDLHAPGAAERDGVYAFAAMGGAAAPGVDPWARRLGAALAPRFAAERFVRGADYPTRFPLDTHPSFTRWAAAQGLAGFSLETSYLGLGGADWDVDDWRAAGAAIADALAAGG